MEHKGTKRIETERLILRPFVKEDAPAMYKNWASDERVTKYLTWPTHASVEASAAVLADWTESYARSDFYQWAIVWKELDEPIGSISVVHYDDSISAVSVGYCIGYDFWHRGVTSEAFSAVIDFLFDEVGVNRIEAQHDVNNPRSGAVMKKCGLRYEGTLRQSAVNNCGVSDMSICSVLREDR